TIALLALLPEPVPALAPSPLYERPAIFKRMWKLFPVFFCTALATACYFAARRKILGAYFVPQGSITQPLDNPLVQLTGLARLLGDIEVLAFNARALMAPFSPSPDYGLSVIPLAREISDPLWLPGLLVLAAAGTGIKLLQRRPAPLWGLLFMA